MYFNGSCGDANKNRMKDLTEHCYNLSMLVSGVEPEIEWPNQFEWLNVASGIKRIEFDVIRYERSIGWCRNADQWNFNREKLLREYITELTRFTYVWGALESLIDDLNIPQGQKQGKINSICYYLKSKLHPNDIIYPYADLVEHLKYIIKRYDVNKTAMLKRFDARHLSMHGLGVYVIYNLRNSLVHGAIDFPLPNTENEPESFFSEMVNMSTRIILLTLQMIWLAYYRGSGVCSTICWESDDYEEKYDLEEVLRKIHLKDYVVRREVANRQFRIPW